jgi:hypothetical protein
LLSLLPEDHRPDKVRMARGEQRQHPGPALLECHVEGTGVEGAVLLTEGADCFVFAHEPLALGPLIALLIRMPSGDVRVSGRVVRVESARAFGVEIDLDALSDDVRRALETVRPLAFAGCLRLR